MIKDKASIAILCGGKGLRLRPITADIPKPLIKIGTKPILQHIITHFKKFDHKEYFIATGYKSNKIENIRYILTPSGISERTKLTINFMKIKMREYDELKKELES